MKAVYRIETKKGLIVSSIDYTDKKKAEQVKRLLEKQFREKYCVVKYLH